MRNIHGSNSVLDSKPSVNNKNNTDVPLDAAVGSSNNEKVNSTSSFATNEIILKSNITVVI